MTHFRIMKRLVNCHTFNNSLSKHIERDEDDYNSECEKNFHWLSTICANQNFELFCEFVGTEWFSQNVRGNEHSHRNNYDFFF